MPLGYSFVPGGGEGGGEIGVGGGADRSRTPFQDAIKVLSLRIPKNVGPRPIAPAALMNAQGAAGLAGTQNLQQMLQQMLAPALSPQITRPPMPLPTTSQAPRQPMPPPAAPTAPVSSQPAAQAAPVAPQPPPAQSMPSQPMQTSQPEYPQAPAPPEPSAPPILPAPTEQSDADRLYNEWLTNRRLMEAQYQAQAQQPAQMAPAPTEQSEAERLYNEWLTQRRFLEAQYGASQHPTAAPAPYTAPSYSPPPQNNLATITSLLSLMAAPQPQQPTFFPTEPTAPQYAPMAVSQPALTPRISFGTEGGLDDLTIPEIYLNTGSKTPIY